MTDSTHLAERLTALEIHVAHQDQVIEDLNDALRQQWDALDRMQRHFDRQIALLKEMEADTRDAPPADEKPPHY